MAVTNTQIKFFESSSGKSLGGSITSTDIVSASLGNLFDNVSGAEAKAGSTKYRCLYVKNTNTTDTLYDAKVYIETNTPASGSHVEIGLGTSAVAGTEQSVANEVTAPNTVTFSNPVVGNPLEIGDLSPNQHKAVWVKREITADAVGYSDDNVVIKVIGDTTI